jgi:acyl transferase domain-containing protein/1-acyl-sn-glycerol-3-phosphate acyltransferase/acyl carrier protein
MGADALRRIIADYDGEIDLAAENSPVSCTVAGGTASIEALFARLQQDQVFARMLSFAVPYHSVKMDPIEDELTSVLSDIRPTASSIPIVSTVSGSWAEGTTFGANYWFQNVRRTVRFADGIRTLLDTGHATLLEQAPHPVLAASINEILGGRAEKAVVLPSLRRKDDERAALLRSLGTLYTQGRAIDWDGVHEGHRASVRLPLYPWQRERHWFNGVAESERQRGDAVASNAADHHPVLGRRVRSAHPLWESSLRGDALAYLDDHQIQGAVVFPGAAYVEMALSAAKSLQAEGSDAPIALRGVEFSRALFLRERDKTVVQLGITGSGTGARFEVHSSTGGGASWTLHASGEVVAATTDTGAGESVADIRARCTTSVSHDDCYAALGRRGLEYGPAFRGITELFTGTGEALGRISVSTLDAGRYDLHPALLDAAFQLLISAAGGTSAEQRSDTGVFLPVLLRGLTLNAPAGGAFWAHARVVSFDDKALEGDIQIIDDAGRVLASARGFRCQRLDDARTGESIDEWLYEYRWEELAAAGALAHSVVTAEPSDIAATVQLEADALRTSSHWGDYYTQVEPRLNALAMGYIAAALREIGGTMDRVVPARHALGEFLLSVGAAETVVEASELETQARAIVADHPDYVTDVALVVRCGSSLGDILAGRVDAGSVLFGGDGFEQLTRFYREAPPSRYYNALAASAVATAVASAGPATARPVRVLEIGGGTGGTTAFVLPALEGARVEYVFTDVTSIFTEQAKETFSAAPGFAARTLDIERDPVAQGFAAHGFDVILAANVLHATPSLSGTLANVRQLLAPGGALVLLEITRRPLWTDLIFGITDGWWRFTDRADRPSHPLLAAHAWRAVLAREGFAAVTSAADAAPLGESAQTVLLARGADLAPSQALSEAARGPWLVFADTGGTGRTLGDRLTSAGVDITIVERGPAFARTSDGTFAMPADDRGAVTTLLSTLDAEGRRPRGIVHCWSLDTASPEHVDGDRVLETQRAGLGSTLALVQSLVALGGTQPELWLVTSGAQHVTPCDRLATAQAPMWGFGRVISKEHPALRARLIDLGLDIAPTAIDALADELTSGAWEDELSLHGGIRHVRRLHRVTRNDEALREPRRSAVNGEGYRAEVGTEGALESMALRVVERRAPAKNEVEIAVQAAGINFRDVMLAMGLYPTIAGEASFGRGLLGLDCAGTVTAVGEGVSHVAVGDDVVGIGAGTFGAYATTAAPVVVRRPANLTVTQGAAVPSVFVTAYYSLRHLANLQAGERVLIHSATGGVGLAAIQVAREVGAEVFATAGSAEKRAYLRALGIEHVMDSRSLSFADEILALTDGEGVDVVLNSLAGDAIPRGIGVLRGYGRFVEIGKRDIFQDSRIGLLAFRKNLAFFGVDVDRLSLDRPELAARMLREVMSRFETGVYTPLPETLFPISDIEGAMRFMAQAKHIGKVVLSMDDPAVVVTASAPRGALFREDGTYLISGGLGGFGLATVEWMMSEGARHFALMGRRGAQGDAASRVEALRARGARIEVMSADISVGADVRRVLDTVRRTMPPLRGVIHGAMVLDDASLVDLDRARVDRVLAPKMTGAWHLHRETLQDPLDCFVMLSSLTALFGNPLQANYAAANAFLDALAHERRALGRPALSINWGPLAEVGYVAQHRDVADYLDRLGYLAFTPVQAFEILGTLLRRGATHLMAARIDWPRWARSSQTAAGSAMLRHLAPSPAESAARRNGESAAVGGSLRSALLSASPTERTGRVIAFLREKVAKVLGLSAAKLDDSRALTELGFDSLMAVELMTVLRVELGVELAAVKLLQGVSIAGLATEVLSQVGAGEATNGANDVVTASPRPEVASVVAADTSVSVARGAPPGSEATTPTSIHSHQTAAPSPIPTPTPHTNGAIHAAPATAPAPSHYATLDYSRWTTGQRAVKSAVTIAMKTLSRIDVEGLENLPRTGGCLLAINHLSMADGPVIFSLLPRRTVMFASIHLQRSALMHWVLSDMGDAIYVRRGEGDTDALESGLAVLRAGGLLGIGPEGTRSPTGLARGHTGIAYLATQTGVPVVPLAAWGQEKISMRLRSFRRTPVQVRIGTPLRFTGGTSDAAHLRDVTDQVMRSIAAMLPPAYQGVYQTP